VTGPAAEEVAARFPDAIALEEAAAGELVAVVEPAEWPAVARWLADAGFGFLSDLCGVDRPGRDPRFEVVYTLTDMQTPRRLRVRLPLPDADPPRTASVTSVWPGAEWFERETYDMFGIVFDGHPDLRRILMPDEWEGHPLRKDYAIGKVPIEFKHLSPGS
jgi:NADH-quinone oxidoreductase subunit C